MPIGSLRLSTGASLTCRPQCTNPGRTLPTLPHRSGSAQWQGSTVHAPFIVRLAISLSESGLAVAPRRRDQKPIGLATGERRGREERIDLAAGQHAAMVSAACWASKTGTCERPRRTGVNHSLFVASIHAYSNQ